MGERAYINVLQDKISRFFEEKFQETEQMIKKILNTESDEEDNEGNLKKETS